MSPEDMTVVGIPLASRKYQRGYLLEAVHGECVELLMALVPMKHAHPSFQIFCLSAAQKISSLLQTVATPITRIAAEEFDSLIERTLASIIAE